MSIDTCPVIHRSLHVGDELRLPLHQRTVAQYATGDEGRRELRLYYGDKEISFDEPELFRFGETLARSARFAAGDAVAWGEGLDWPRVRDLLQALLDEGVLRRADETDDDRRIAGEDGVRPNPLPPAQTTVPRSWHELPGLMQELTGRPLEIGWLELVVPIFRIAHMDLDAEGRQVGEANAFPAALRLDVPTKWRTCIYAGTRFQDPKPMNVTALKAMRAHWGPMMAGLLRVRAAYLTRYPEAARGWTVGHLERLSTAVLALPAYLLMRREGRVANGALHPVLSSMFRVTDGLRMTMHQMLFVPYGEPTLSPDAPMTPAEVHAYAERNFAFHSDHGVCAGPKAMVDEFLSVIIDGATPRDGLPDTLEPALEAALDAIDPAMDYALLGLQAYAAVFSLWPLMTRSYESLARHAADWAAEEPRPAVQALAERLAAHVHALRNSPYLAKEAWRADREHVYADMFGQCGRGIDGTPPEPDLAQRLRPTPVTPAAVLTLAAVVTAQCGPGDAPARVAWQTTLLDFCARAQAVIRTACGVQMRINALLGRDVPARPFDAQDIDLHIHLTGAHDGRLPFLPDELERLLGLRVRIDACRIDFSLASAS